MNSSKPSRVSDTGLKKLKLPWGNPLFLALVLSLILIMTLILLLLFSGDNEILLRQPWLLLLYFFLAFILIYLILSRFIFEKIRVIYKNIIEFKTGKKTPWLITYNALNKTHKDVENWITTKTKEITVLKEAEKYRREFLGNLAHELKTPLTTIQGYVLTLLDGGLYDNEINMKYLRRTVQNIERLRSIINDLDEIARLEKGLESLHMKNFDFYSLLVEVIEMFENIIQKKKINIRNNIKPHEVIVFADPDKIRQVIINLLDNAIKYSDEKGSIEIEAYSMEDRYLIEITDHGIGIDAEDIPRIFERFFRTEKSRNKVKEGSGLGLSIVKHIIEAHEQSIHARSAPNVGTTISFTLSRARGNNGKLNYS